MTEFSQCLNFLTQILDDFDDFLAILTIFDDFLTIFSIFDDFAIFFKFFGIFSHSCGCTKIFDEYGVKIRTVAVARENVQPQLSAPL